MVRRTVKKMLQYLAILLVSPLLLLYFLMMPLSRRDVLFASFAQFLSLWPGILGSYIRVAFYRCTMKKCDADCFIGFSSLFSQQGIEVHRGAYIGPQCNIGLSCIGENTLLGSGVHILSGKNQHSFDDPSRPFKEQGGIFEKVEIGANCWIGNGAIVMASIGEGSIVGAGSVVINDLPAGVIAAGNPAKVIRVLSAIDKTKPYNGA